jgi:hypothetical protein
VEPKKEIQPIDRLQHVFNDLLADLEATVKRTWAYQDLEERLPLQEALDAKLDTHKQLFAQAMEVLQNMEVQPPAEGNPKPCDYCDGAGGTPSPFHESGEYTIPCIACDGSGVAP